MVVERIPKRFGLNPMTDVQVLCPMNRGSCGTIAMNQRLQAALNPDARISFKCGERLFKSGDRVMQTSNNYDKGVFNGDLGRISSVNYSGKRFRVDFDGEEVEYEFHEAEQLNLAYAVTVHKSQGSEFPAVLMPMLTQHYMMLQRNLLYTGVTRAKRLMVLIGSEKAISMAVRNVVKEPRHSLLLERIERTFAAITGGPRG
jgi:exodeoxyribonuclease V alpha subunit